MGSKPLHVAVLSSPGMGHLIPVMVLGNHLAIHYNIKVTILAITTSSSPAESQILKGPSDGKNAPIDIVPIPSVDVSGLIDSNTKVFTQLRIIVRETLPRIRSAISNLIHCLDALIVDLFGTSALSIANEFNIPKYVYHTSNAWSSALIVYTQIFDKEIQGQYVDQNEPLKVPGCKSIRPEDVVDPMVDRNDQQYDDWMIQGIEYNNSDGVLMNTWEEIEPSSIQALRENEQLLEVIKVPIYPIGPLIRKADENRKNVTVMQWLNNQPLESVLYVCFGSGGTLSSKQIIELAFGLELSQRRFIWVVGPPSDSGAPDASFFTAGQGTEINLNYLPEGFVTRTKHVGLVIPVWAEQVEILSHPSVGGFLTHCGWNSILESVNNGIPMIAWPLYAEQKMNATMLTEELGIAVRPEVLPTKKIVGREEIEKMVRMIMQFNEGKTMREKVKKLKMSAENALSKGGSSYNAMCQLLQDIEMKTTSMSHV